jgi:hypothetical protein
MAATAQVIPTPAFAPVLKLVDFAVGEDGKLVALDSWDGSVEADKGEFGDVVEVVGETRNDDVDDNVDNGVDDGFDDGFDDGVDEGVDDDVGVDLGDKDDGVEVPGNCSGLIAAKVSLVGSSQLFVPLG